MKNGTQLPSSFFQWHKDIFIRGVEHLGVDASHSLLCPKHPLSTSRNHRVLQHMANISQTYQVSDQALKSPFHEHWDYKHYWFSHWAFCACILLAMNNNSVFWRGVRRFWCRIWLKEWVLVKSTVESKLSFAEGTEGDCMCEKETKTTRPERGSNEQCLNIVK